MILELGAGVGLVGLYCLRDAKPKAFIFTDHHEMVMRQLERNIELNYKKECSDGLISVQNLDWINIEEINENKLKVDVILASGKNNSNFKNTF